MSFSRDYAEARAKFRAATADLRHGALDVVDGYTVDWAWAGPQRTPRDRVIVLTSGLHGIEGFPGSAVQLRLLEAPLPVPTLLIHTLNPWGMAHYRRFNESNVDLNRNFLAPGGVYHTEDPTYAVVDELLNPKTPPGGLELFWPRVAWLVARYGYQTLKNAVAGGQHQNEAGLFYGGARLEPGPELLLAMLDVELADADRVVHIDLHSGIGRFGGRTLLLDGKASETQLARARAAFGVDVKGWDPSNTHAYEIRGGMLAEVTRRAADRARPTRYDGFTCEFGTMSNLAVLARLRAENRLHHWGPATNSATNSPTASAAPQLDHWAKAGMREAFAPLDAAWESAVLGHAPEVYAAARVMLDS